MRELIEAIRLALEEGASAETKQAGANACRAILAALKAAPGQSLAGGTVPPVAATHPLAALAGLNLDQILELAINRIRAALPEEVRAATAPRPALKIPYVSPPPKKPGG